MSSYDHTCFSCQGKGARAPSSWSYEYFVPADGAPLPIKPPDAGPVECSDCRGSGLSEGHVGSRETCSRCARQREELAPLIEALRPLLRSAFRVTFTPIQDADALPLFGTHLGGRPYAEAGETWPVCTGCRQPLTFIGQFDLRVVDAPAVGLLTFYFCWACMESGLEGSWSARVHPDPAEGKSVDLRPPAAPPHVVKPCAARGAPSLSHPTHDELPEPHPVARRICPEAPCEPYAAAIEALLGDYPITHQLGGWARWIQHVPRAACRLCGSRLDLVVQIDSDDDADCDWGLSGLAYLRACRAHPAEVSLEIQRT